MSFKVSPLQITLNLYEGIKALILFLLINQIILVTRNRKREYNGAMSDAFNPLATRVGEMSLVTSSTENALYNPMVR